MAEVVGSMSEYARRFETLVDPTTLAEMGRAAGMAAKTAGLQVVAVKLGPDRAMSGFKSGRVRLGLGFDYEPGTTRVLMNHRPPGLWVLADRGRVTSGPIYPRSRGRQQGSGPRPVGYRRGSGSRPGAAVLTPRGYRAYSSWKRSSGTGVLRLAEAREKAAAPPAAHKAMQRRIVSIVHGGATVGRWVGGV